jgi:hypothetical protein
MSIYKCDADADVDADAVYMKTKRRQIYPHKGISKSSRMKPEDNVV